MVPVTTDRVRADVDDLGSGKIHCNVGMFVVRRVANLVQELLYHRESIHETARARQFGYGCIAILLNNRYGKSYPMQVVDDFVRWIGEIPASHLSGALEKMADALSLGQKVPVVVRPIELVNQRRQELGGVARPAGDHDIRTHSQRLYYSAPAYVGVGSQ